MKKVLLGIFTVLAVLLFSDKVSALECLYDPYDIRDEGRVGKIYLEQYSEKNWGTENYKARVRTLMPTTFTYEGTKGEYQNGTYYADADNNDEWNNGWKEVTDCPPFLIYQYNGGDGFASSKDKAYTCDSLKKCKYIDKGDIFVHSRISEASDKKTPQNVSLNDMYCTYENGSGDITYNFHIRFKKNKDNTYTGSYKLFRNYKELYENQINNLEYHEGPQQVCSNSGEYTECKTYYDSFSIRVFWDEKENFYQCPPSIAVEEDFTYTVGSYGDRKIYIGYKDDKVGTSYFNVGFLFFQTNSNKTEEYKLKGTTSYIDYNTDSFDDNICVYTRESEKCNEKNKDCKNNKSVTLIEREFNDGRKEYLSALNLTGTSATKNIATNVQINKLNCNELEFLYTDCLKTSNKNCTVSDLEFQGSEKIVTDKYANTQDINNAIEGMGNYTGRNYKKMTCELFGRLKSYAPISELQKTTPLIFFEDNMTQPFSYSITGLPCSSWGYSDDYICESEECKDSIQRIAERKAIEIKNYCNDTYAKYHNTPDNFRERYNECKEFDKFYDSLVENGIINDVLLGCDLFEGEMKDKINFIFDIIKIAGPILAIILGMLDFTKVLVSGDADKEMKTAWKNFKVRLFAAFLLFIIPIILSLLINIFIGDKIGRDPYCGLLETSER